ncbi:MAG: GntR family transcriptional regulator [Lentisphaeria bacterium]
MMSINRTGVIKKMIVRHIQDENLKSRDKLPSIDFFRRHFGCGTTTVAAAFSELRDEGVLTIRDKIGAFVLDQSVAGHAGRVIGISVFTSLASAMSHIYIVALQQELNQRGCIAKLFFSQKPPEEGRFEFSCDDFPGLVRSVKEASIDALIHFGKFDRRSMKFLSAHGIPELFCGFLADKKANCCVCDFGRILESMFDCDGVRSAKRPFAFIPPSATDILSAIFTEKSGDSTSICVTPRTRNDRFSSEIASRFASMSASKRPDMLIFFDDFIASAVLMNLALMISEDKMPGAAILMNTELTIAYPPMKQLYTWRLNIHEFAELSAEKFTAALRAGETNVGSVYYEPVYSDLSFRR